MTTTLILIAALTLAIATVGRTVAIGLAVYKVPARYGAEVLRGLAECFRFWRK
ncbi:hypothetical protein [Nocardia sp. NPDC051833]|uniref:hypothetical protein n=1 Tax=Nocardia sp. NPDC051833 TaxID=3155674 RepID=UPI0034203F92